MTSSCRAGMWEQLRPGVVVAVRERGKSMRPLGLNAAPRTYKKKLGEVKRNKFG